MMAIAVEAINASQSQQQRPMPGHGLGKFCHISRLGMASARATLKAMLESITATSDATAPLYFAAWVLPSRSPCSRDEAATVFEAPAAAAQPCTSGNVVMPSLPLAAEATVDRAGIHHFRQREVGEQKWALHRGSEIRIDECSCSL